MADATASHQTHRPREVPRRPQRASEASTPLPLSNIAIQGKRRRDANLRPIDHGKAHAARLAKRQQWATLNLRQEWADEAFMRGHLKAAGVKFVNPSEPATVKRVQVKLRAVGVFGPEIRAAVGKPIRRFLEANPMLPLWAALALILETIGRFTPQAQLWGEA